MNLSKSRYCRGIQCPKMLWLEKYKPEVKEEVDNASVLENGNMVHEVARYLFGEHVNIEYTDNLKEMIDNTYSTIESYEDVVITEASFNYENNFCSVDILKKNKDKYEMYEVKGSTGLKEVYINDASYQYYVLTSLGFKVTKCSVLIINRDYERMGNLELDKLFLENDITKTVIDLQDTVKENVKKINEYMENVNERNEAIDYHCYDPYHCVFFNYCTRDLPQPNVFNITREVGPTAMDLYKDGYVTFEELLKTDIGAKYRKRIEFELYDKPDYIDKERIKEFLDTLSYPLYFLDFETYQMPVPLYDHVHPYEQAPFQYSLHYYEKEGGELKHTEYLGIAGTDPRRLLAEQLVHDIPMNACTLAYSMKFERGVIRRLAEIYPDLSKHLMNIHDHIYDLEIPFRKGYYYTKKMDGSSSIKKVLPALFPSDPSLDYHNLDQIHNGSEAMNSFRAMENMDEKELANTRENLLKYCGLDTYAMVKLYDKLKEVVKDE